jgi:rSAM/selenodomain-associated transferase 1
VEPIIPSIKRVMLVCIKAPSPGDVKTRLIPALSSDESAQLYRCFVADAVRALNAMPLAPRMLVSYASHPKMPTLSWLGKNPPEMFKQEGKSLGEKIIHAFGIAFGRGAQQAVMIGCDTPTLPMEYIQKAFKALESSDVVLGPTTTGSYYLVGLSRPCMNIFDNVCWSGDQIFESTVLNAQKQGYKLRVLPTHYDVETIESLRKLHSDRQAR